MAKHPSLNVQGAGKTGCRTFAGLLLAPVLCSLLYSSPMHAATAAETAHAIREAGLDPAECYRVRDLKFSTDRAKFFFNEGYLILGHTVDGKRVTALFSSDVEGGDAEILLLPPNRAERQSLSSYTGSPNLDEHFNTALMLFSPDVLTQLTDQIASSPSSKKAPEMGALLDSKFSSVARHVTASFGVRLTWSLLAPGSNRGFFCSVIQGKQLGNFDLVYDPSAPEQLSLGAISSRENQPSFDIWTSFRARNAEAPPKIAISDYRIDANVNSDLSMEVVTRYRVRVEQPSPVVPVELSDLMRVNSATIDGAPAEVLQHADVRPDLMRKSGSELTLLVATAPLEAGRDHEVEIHHAGSVIIDAGNHVYYVASRSNWYPGWGNSHTLYDLTFHVPKHLHIVLPGTPVSEAVEGESRTTRTRIESPVRAAGFNLGVYERTSVARSGFTVDVYANREFENALKSNTVVAIEQPALTTNRRTRTPPTGLSTATPPMMASPPNRLQALASSIAGAMDYFTSLFGPPPLRRLEVTPVPGTFGQGFPGLIYLSTLSYLSPASDAQGLANPQHRIFFEQLMEPHEAAHQWWGNVVFHSGYHDEWITESLANYSALMYLDKQHGGRKVSDALLNSYREELLKNNLEAAGPITQGRRLESAATPSAWRAITYGKGTWIVHMLRARLGDTAFLKMLASLRQEYERQEISTEQFRLHCARFLPPGAADKQLEGFFDQWVYGTGIPQLKLTWKAKPGRVTGSVKQAGVADDFSTEVTLEIRTGGKAIRKTIRTDNDGAEFSFPVAGTAAKVILDPDNTLLHRP